MPMLLWLPLIFMSALFEIATLPSENAPDSIRFDEPKAP
jgi:hypothetical protein